MKYLRNALQCKCRRRKSRCWLPVWWSMNKAYFFKPKCSTSWALETQFHPRLLPLLLFGLPAVSFMLYYVTMQCFLMCEFRRTTHCFLVLNSRDYLVHKRPHQTIVFWFNLKMAGLRILRLWCVIDAVIAWTWWNSNLTWWKFAIVRSNCELTPILCTPAVMIFRVVEASKPCEFFGNVQPVKEVCSEKLIKSSVHWTSKTSKSPEYYKHRFTRFHWDLVYFWEEVSCNYWLGSNNALNPTSKH